jgi:outer membrane protein OmpA-like peptidoglycan-associated protein
VLERVFFDTDRATLKPESADTLDKVAASLKDFPDVKIQVAGHTDNTGSDAHNMKLSEARAKSVMDYLVSKGVSPAMLSAKGYGETEPIADNNTKEGRAQNRRVGLRRVD